MRIAIVSDIHGNLPALEAVIEDLAQTSPDLVLHGGDLPFGGASPAKVVDRIRDLGWQGVVGNTDEMLFRPESLAEFAAQSPAMKPVLAATEAMAAACCEALGEERLAWLAKLPATQAHERMTLVHARPGDCWRSPGPEASDEELESAYSAARAAVVVYGHIHRAYIRRVSKMTVVNAGSVSLPYDGDPRASYLLLDDFQPSIRRVAYDLDRELNMLSDSGLPHADWIARTLRSARPQAP